MRKFATTIRLSIWPRIKSALDESIGLRNCKINKSEREIRLPNGTIFVFVGADDPQKLKSIEDVTDFWLEEANEFTEEDLDTIDAGLSADCWPPPQIGMTFNPIPSIPGFQFWIQRRFMNVETELGEIRFDDDVALLRTYYKNNRYCPSSVIKVLEKYRRTNPELWKMWGLGEFTTLKGVILNNWEIVKSVPEGMNFVGYGLDFGFANDPLALIAVYKNHNELWLDEKLYALGMLNKDLSDNMELLGLRKGVDEIIADCAEPKSITELNSYGWIIQPAYKSPDYKRAAANYLRSFEKIHITEHSTNLIREVATWSWKQDKQGSVLPIVADGNDHGMDATIYRIFRKTIRWGVA